MSSESQDIIFFDIEDKQEIIEQYVQGTRGVYLDLLDSMLVELTLNKHPEIPKGSSYLNEALQRIVEEKESRKNGVFIFYPWKDTLVRILDEEDFIFLRTVRNRNKIRTEEQSVLSGKCTGIIGLSVGYSVLMAMALERVCSHFKIADFDCLELSNLNRIYQPLTNIGLNKAIAAKRAVLELDPYLRIEIFEEGINENNIGDFIIGTRKLDLLVDECDSGFVKFLSRYFARENAIPVLMETSDRGVLDIERYDLDGNYPLLHGRFSEFPLDWSELKKLDKELLFASIDFNLVSKRGLESMSLIGEEIRTWPQLGSDVLSGGASVALVARKIFLGHIVESSRNYLDIESKFN
jgi:molybdopterin/thiamine biosynthesis adenylyltransferase